MRLPPNSINRSLTGVGKAVAEKAVRTGDLETFSILLTVTGRDGYESIGASGQEKKELLG